MTFAAFRGSTSWEMQIGKLVLQIPFRMVKRGYAYDSWLCRNFGLHAWIDPHGKWVR